MRLCEADPQAWLQSLPASAACADPARWRVLQALARRASAEPPGLLRALLAAKLEARWAAWPIRHASVPTVAQPSLSPSPLRQLIDDLPSSPELRANALHRRSFTRLRVEHRLAPLQVPPVQVVGPLNAMALLPRALKVLGEASPEYLQRLLGFLEGLAGLGAPEKAMTAALGAKAEKAKKRRA